MIGEDGSRQGVHLQVGYLEFRQRRELYDCELRRVEEELLATRADATIFA